jgi:agmatinase
MVGRRQVDLDFLPDRVYLSIDVDVLDPSVMPSTGTPEPGGLTWYGLMAVLEQIVAGRTVLGFDVVELCPQAANHAPDFTVAKLVYKLMGFTLKPSPKQGEECISHGKERKEEEEEEKTAR